MVPLNCTFFSLFLAQYMPCPDALGYLESQYRLLILLYHDIVRRVSLKENHTNRHMAAPFHEALLFFSEQHLA